ncbi:MAG: hypothetical protein QE274_04820 [Verrucomicrobiaceae bacterium]|nr:hypothetical protein [Verrucomicrobiaceae bacterium]
MGSPIFWKRAVTSGDWTTAGMTRATQKAPPVRLAMMRRRAAFERAD